MSSPEKDFPESEMSSDPTGFNTAPSHYAQQERETIDRIHDIMTDQEFKMFCLGQVVKYADRLPHKGASGEDLAKANWYGQMALHMEDRAPDPRWQREGFVPYQRQPAPPMQEMPFSMDQEPTVMPGFTALATDPWPPLSREQVVELHEALVDFRHTMEASKSLRGDDEQAALIWEAATSLDGLLVSLGIGTPPPTKRWTEDQLQQAVEEVQRHPFEQQYPADFPPSPDGLFKAEDIKVDPMLPPGTVRMRAPTGEVVEVNIGTYPAVYRTVEEAQAFEPLANIRLMDSQGHEADLLQVKPGDVLTAHLRAFGVVPGSLAAYAPTVRWATPDELQQAVREVQEPMMVSARLVDHEGNPVDPRRVERNTVVRVAITASPASAPSAGLVTSPLGEVKHNCGTCRNCNLPYSIACAIAAEGTPSRRWRDALSMDALSEEMLLNQLVSTADNCPGWEQKP